LYARSVASDRKHVLFIDDAVPVRIAGSGFVRANDLIAAMTAIGFAVTVYPLATPEFSRFSLAPDLAETVEVIQNGTASRLAQFLRERPGVYDVLWVARTHNLELVCFALEDALENSPRPLLILDTEAIAAIRDAERARMTQQPFDLDAALAAELRHAALCQHIVAVSRREAEILDRRGFADVTVIGHVRDVRLTGRRYADRSGMLFVGAIHEIGSPNHDGLCWLIDEVLPLVERELGWQTRLTVAGYLAPGVSLEGYRNHPRVTLCGPVTDITPLYDSHRVFVAPTRFAAGAPYKVHEAASFGLPIVATDVLNAQLEWQCETDILVAGSTDPVEFSRHLVRLQRNEALWQKLRAAAAARITAENGRDRYSEALRRVLGSPIRSPAVPSGDVLKPVL
ncbi:MAG TPA: glycosyltransferase family 4 protein, partial [Acetobacteraceae bacterium]